MVLFVHARRAVSISSILQQMWPPPRASLGTLLMGQQQVCTAELQFVPLFSRICVSAVLVVATC
jgi:hypothetical protein